MAATPTPAKQTVTAEATHRKKIHKENLIFAALLAIGAPLAVGISDAQEKASDSSETIKELVTSNYEVQSVPSIKDASFLGYDIAVTVDNTTYECQGVTKGDLRARNSLFCDGLNLNAKSWKANAR